MKDIIKDKLLNLIAPEYLEVIDESHKHAGHGDMSGKEGTHFVIKIKAKSLEDMGRVQSHRMIYSYLQEEIKQGVHALSIKII